MQSLPASAGWEWIRQGFALFCRQPGQISRLFVLYITVTLLLTIIPGIGMIVRFALIPAFSMAFMNACARIECDIQVRSHLLFSALRKPEIQPLLLLGLFYLLAVVLAMATTTAFDGGLLWQSFNTDTATLATTPDASTLEDTRPMISMLFCCSAYLLFTLPFWFAAPLIAWQKMSVGKAVFFSVFSVWRAIKAIALYVAAWVGIFMGVTVTVSSLLQLLQIGSLELQTVILMPFVILLAIVLYCSFYPSYTQVFGLPPLPSDN